MPRSIQVGHSLALQLGMPFLLRLLPLPPSVLVWPLVFLTVIPTLVRQQTFYSGRLHVFCCHQPWQAS